MKSLRPASLILAALAMSSGVAAPSQGSLTINAATQASQHAALKVGHRAKSALPSFILNEGRRYGLFKHSRLNQRQRRKFNRQRNAAGVRNAFA